MAQPLEDRENKVQNPAPPAQAAGRSETGAVDTDFMKERIKQRPINRRRLLRRTLITGCMALLFGGLACLVFVLLEPVLAERINPKESPGIVSFPEESQEDEITPEEMIADDAELFADAYGSDDGNSEAISAGSFQYVDTMQIEGIVNRVIQRRANGMADYARIQNSLRDLAADFSASLAVVTAVNEETDWLSDPYETRGRSSGVVIADNGEEYLILVNYSAVRGAGRILVGFAGGAQAEAYIKGSDITADMAVLAVELSSLEAQDRARIRVASLGSSMSSGTAGAPVVAVGAPNGTYGSIMYGNITGTSTALGLPDSRYRLITTDIYAATDATGVLINTSGKVVGIVQMNRAPANMPGALSAVGITELKSVISVLSNGGLKGYFGLRAVDVPEISAKELGLPDGVYVMNVEMDSPAMLSGIMSGDVITAVSGTSVDKAASLVEILDRTEPGEEVIFTVLRSGAEGYVEYEIPVIPRENGERDGE